MENLSVGLEGMNFESFILNELKNLNTRLDQVLSLIINDRVHFDEKWAENERKWIENEQKWAENEQKWAENEQKWAEFKAYSDEKWAANDARWDANDARWDADDLKWEINDIRWVSINSILDDLIASFLEFKKDNLKFDEFMRVKVGALGARWVLRQKILIGQCLKVSW